MPDGVVGALEQRDAVAARGGVERDPRAGDAAADDDDVELVLGQRRKSLGALDHEPQSRTMAFGKANALRGCRARAGGGKHRSVRGPARAPIQSAFDLSLIPEPAFGARPS